MPTANRIELYMFRHAQSFMNLRPDLVGGRSNEVSISKEGVKQAKRLGHYLGKLGIIPQVVFATPALRTNQTAYHSLKEMGLDMPIIIQGELQELCQGVWEGKPRAKAYTPEVIEEIEQLGKDFKFEGGQSMNEVGQQVHEWAEANIPDNPENEVPTRYFAYTHGGTIKYWASHLNNWSHHQTYSTPVDNASTSLFVRENGQWRMEYINRDASELGVK